MELPKIRSARIKKVTIGESHFKLQPWSNKEMIQFETIKESLPEGATNADIFKEVYDVLIKPNVIEGDASKVNDAALTHLFVEMYKLARGSTIDFTFKCSSGDCGRTTSAIFNINKHYKYKDMSSFAFETKDFSFQLKHSNFSTIVNPSSDEDLKYVLSFVKSFSYKGKEYSGFTLDELVDFFVSEVDEKNYIGFMKKIYTCLPRVELQGGFICEHCGHESNIILSVLPDFLIFS